MNRAIAVLVVTSTVALAGCARGCQEPSTVASGVYLKTLTLKGFKSFADTTVLDLEREASP